MTVLLSESERECARMAQLAELLKAELRRVRGTTHNAHNTEYMKNVTLKVRKKSFLLIYFKLFFIHHLGKSNFALRYLNAKAAFMC